MKKTILALLFIAVIAFILFAFTSEKKYKFEFSDQQLNQVWQVIDASSAPHDQVKAVQGLIQQQLKGQMDTTKKK
jgi:hypothetical protein